MAEFEVTDPNGKTFIVNAPEGATQEQALNYAKIKFGGSTAGDTATPSGEMSEREFTQARQSAATQEPTFQKFARATIPTLAAGAALIPGPQQPFLAGAAGQALLGAGSTAVNQAVGLEPQSTEEIAKGGLFGLAGGLVTPLGKAGIKAGAEMIAPGPMKEAGVEAGAQLLGAPARSVERVFATPASRAAYDAVQRQGPVVTDDIAIAINDGLQKISGLSNPPKAAQKYLTNLGKKYFPGGIADYGDVVDELQLLKQNADSALRAGNVPTGKALYKMRGEILDVLDQTSPAIKKANRIYRREQATQEVVNSLRSSNAANHLRKTFETDPLISGAVSKSEYEELEKLAMKITEIPSAGAVGGFRSTLMALTQPLANALMTRGGRAMLRQVMKPTNGITPAGAAAVAQFMRAYSASGAEE